MCVRTWMRGILVRLECLLVDMEISERWRCGNAHFNEPLQPKVAFRLFPIRVQSAISYIPSRRGISREKGRKPAESEKSF